MTGNLDRYARALLSTGPQRHVEVCLEPEVAWSLLRMAQRACQFQSPDSRYLREGAIAIQRAIAMAWDYTLDALLMIQHKEQYGMHSK